MTIASQTSEVTINDMGNDLVFIISPMSATKAEMWLARALSAIGPGLGDALSGSGIDFKAIMGDIGKLISGITKADPDQVIELTNHLYGCAKRKLPDGGTLDVSPATLDGFVRSPETLIRLKAAILKANFDFFGLGSRFGSHLQYGEAGAEARPGS